jgi:hypothetical protein
MMLLGIITFAGALTKPTSAPAVPPQVTIVQVSASTDRLINYAGYPVKLITYTYQ